MDTVLSVASTTMGVPGGANEQAFSSRLPNAGASNAGSARTLASVGFTIISIACCAGFVWAAGIKDVKSFKKSHHNRFSRCKPHGVAPVCSRPACCPPWLEDTRFAPAPGLQIRAGQAPAIRPAATRLHHESPPVGSSQLMRQRQHAGLHVLVALQFQANGVYGQRQVAQLAARIAQQDG